MHGGRFRADIEGLRAVAVVLVVLYHAGIGRVAGGYVGVDVFFVLSGFLITGLLWRELEETGRISLRRFYARRIRRLLALSTFVLVATVVVGAVVLSPLQARDLMADARAAGLYVANVRFASLQADYFTADAPPSPLLHYWSLAVEEQFYVIWPLLLIVARRAAALAIGLVGVASFAACVIVTADVQPSAFFLLPTRAWELAVGGALALALPRLRRISPGQGAALAWAGLAAIAWSATTFDAATSFPGAAAAVPVLGTAAVVWGGSSSSRRGPALLLAAGPMRQVGRWSYAWYLFHWPALVLGAAAVGRPLAPVENLALAATSFWFAAAAHYLIENPVRFAPRLPAFRVGAALTALVVVVPLVVGARLPSLEGRGEPMALAVAEAPNTTAAPAVPTAPRELVEALALRAVPSTLTPSLSKARADKPRIYADKCHRAGPETSIKGCVYGVAGSPTTVVLFGDSHAAHWFPALERIAVERRWRLLSLTKSACPPVDAPIFNPDMRRPYSECTRWRARALERIASERAAVVVMGITRGYDASFRLATYSPQWHAALGRMVTKLRHLGAVPVVMGATPILRLDVPACLSSHLDDVQACTRPTAEAINAGGGAAEAEAVRSGGGTFVDPAPWMCLDRCAVIVRNLLVFRDTSHLTTVYAESLVPRLAAALPPVPST